MRGLHGGHPHGHAGGACGGFTERLCAPELAGCFVCCSLTSSPSPHTLMLIWAHSHFLTSGRRPVGGCAQHHLAPRPCSAQAKPLALSLQRTHLGCGSRGCGCVWRQALLQLQLLLEHRSTQRLNAPGGESGREHTATAACHACPSAGCHTPCPPRSCCVGALLAAAVRPPFLAGLVAVTVLLLKTWCKHECAHEGGGVLRVEVCNSCRCSFLPLAHTRCTQKCIHVWVYIMYAHAHGRACRCVNGRVCINRCACAAPLCTFCSKGAETQQLKRCEPLAPAHLHTCN